MKLLAVCLAVSVTSAFAVDPASFENRYSSGSGYTPDGIWWVTLFDQTYVYEEVKSAWRHDAICDDFILDNDATVDGVRFWIIYTGLVAPTDYDLKIAHDTAGDSDPNNATIVWMETCPAFLEDTGDLVFTIQAICWEVTCPFPTMVQLTPGERYFLEITCHDNATYDYIILADFDDPYYDFGNMAWSYDGATWIRGDDPSTFGVRRSMFFEIMWYADLQNETWGSIKTLF